MQVTVTLTRVVRQYLDVIVDRVDSVEDAVVGVQDRLLNRAESVKLINGTTWYTSATGENLVEPISIEQAKALDQE